MRCRFRRRPSQPTTSTASWSRWPIRRANATRNDRRNRVVRLRPYWSYFDPARRSAAVGLDEQRGEQLVNRVELVDEAEHDRESRAPGPHCSAAVGIGDVAEQKRLARRRTDSRYGSDDDQVPLRGIGSLASRARPDRSGGASISSCAFAVSASASHRTSWTRPSRAVRGPCRAHQMEAMLRQPSHLPLLFVRNHEPVVYSGVPQPSSRRVQPYRLPSLSDARSHAAPHLGNDGRAVTRGDRRVRHHHPRRHRSSAERSVFRAINELPDALEAPMVGVQYLGVAVVPFIVAAIAAILRQWRLVIAALLVYPLKLLVEKAILKEIVQRPRPGRSEPDAILRHTPADGLSFPSGHSIIAFVRSPGSSLRTCREAGGSSRSCSRPASRSRASISVRTILLMSSRARRGPADRCGPQPGAAPEGSHRAPRRGRTLSDRRLSFSGSSWLSMRRAAFKRRSGGTGRRSRTPPPSAESGHAREEVFGVEVVPEPVDVRPMLLEPTRRPSRACRRRRRSATADCSRPRMRRRCPATAHRVQGTTSDSPRSRHTSIAARPTARW